VHIEDLHDIAISKNMKINSFVPKVQSSQEFQLHNLVVPCTTSTWDDSNNDLVENDELCVMRHYDISFSSDRIEIQMLWMMSPKLNFF
jgi:hypothetical protein